MIPLVFVILVSFVHGNRIVQTNSGPIRGIDLDGKNVEAFFGIPYAEPPVGTLRFTKPVPKSPWTETFDAKQLPPACVQCMMEISAKFINQSEEMDEDCLYLNVWSPRSEATMKPIMIFIHGGGFMTGSSNAKLYDGATLAEHGDVIVASMNYRVGSLGFFSAFIDEAPGSMGMYDQLLAIKWIKDNARCFGGDPDNIVIFGESAGAYSVSLHMVSPLSKSLFKRAIIQSGGATIPLFSDNNDALRASSQEISKLLGCAENTEEFKENPKGIVECMMNLPAEKFAEADDVLFKKLSLLVPRVGDDFLPINPTDMFRKGEFKDTEVLLGVTRDEGGMFTIFQLGFKNDDIYGETIDAKAFNETSAKKIIQSFSRNEDYDKIFQNYLKRVEEESRYTYINAVSDIMGDSFITCSTVFQADFQSLKTHPTYFYVFDYRPPSSPNPEWVGVTHGAELQYVFGTPLVKAFTEYEEKLSNDMMNMWANFAKSGNPSIPGGLQWPQYTYEDPKYVIISLRDSVGVKPDNYRCEAWRNVYRTTIDEDVIRNVKGSSD